MHLTFFLEHSDVQVFQKFCSTSAKMKSLKNYRGFERMNSRSFKCLSLSKKMNIDVLCAYFWVV